MEKVGIKTPEQLKNLVIGNKTFRSAFDYELSPEDLERARVELNETKEVREASLRALKEMISENRMKWRTDDAFLLRFLRCKKFKSKKAYEMMSISYSIRKDYPKAFSDLPSAKNLEIFLNEIITCVPYRDEDGSLVFLERFGKWNFKERSVYEIFHFIQPACAIISMNPCMQIHKFVAIIDLKGFSMSSLPYILYPRDLLFLTKAWQNLDPWRIKSIIIVNCNTAFYLAYKAIRHLLKKKVAERIIIIGSDITELHQYVSPAILPKEYGGSLDDSEFKATTKHVLDNLPYAEYDLSLRSALN